MRRGQKTGAGQVVLKLHQIKIQTSQGKSLALSCTDAEISEQSYYRWRKEYGGLNYPGLCAGRVSLIPSWDGAQ